MNHCNGPCQQGRKACPCPEVCESPEADNPRPSPIPYMLVALGMVALAYFLV